MVLFDNRGRNEGQQAEAPFVSSLTQQQRADLLDSLTTAAIDVHTSGIIPYPNPMGLPPISEA
jgi:hypothetical protein